MKKNIAISFICLLTLFFNCSKSGNNEPTVEETRNLFFLQTEINVTRALTIPVSALIRVSGSPLESPLTVNYAISYPSENAAEEGVDFEFPPTSGTAVIPSGETSTTIELIESISANALNMPKSLSFVLQPQDGSVLGRPNSQDGISVDVTITQDPDILVIGDTRFDNVLSINKDGNTLKIPYSANVQSIDDENPNITRAVIALHGANRNSVNYYNNMMHAARMETLQLDTLLVVSPQFYTESDIVSSQVDDEHLYWSNSGWKIGFLSKDEPQNPRPERVSSFTMIDTLTTRLVQNFPNLKTIVFSGHSAGGQFVNRYAAASPTPTEIENMGVTMQFVSNNPSSYVYMDNRRKVVGTTNFEVPQTTCIAYNEYKYGLEDLPNYLEAVGATQIQSQLLTRNVLYLVGENDNDPSSSSLDTDCEAQLQGVHRLERGVVYWDYLMLYYGNDISNTQAFGIVPNVGHNSTGMFASELGRFYTFRR